MQKYLLNFKSPLSKDHIHTVSQAFGYDILSLQSLYLRISVFWIDMEKNLHFILVYSVPFPKKVQLLANLQTFVMQYFKVLCSGRRSR